MFYQNVIPLQVNHQADQKVHSHQAMQDLRHYTKRVQKVDGLTKMLIY